MTAKPNAAIGVFDSGMGGLTVLRALQARLPRERFVYLGDTARLPYGTKSAETVMRYAVQAGQALRTREVKLIVVACNTASTVALPELARALAPVPVIGVIGPGAEAAVAAAREGCIAVLATEGTVQSGAYARAIARLKPEAHVTQIACPLFVALAEDGLTEGEIAQAVARRYLVPLLAGPAKPDCVVLGCTHFPVLAGTIAQVMGDDVRLVDSAATTAGAVERLLRDTGLSAPAGASPAPSRYLVTDAPERFARIGEIFLGKTIARDDIELLDL